MQQHILLILPFLAHALAQTTCPTTPTDPNCASFRLSDSIATAQVDTLCSEMSGMPGCAIQQQCASGGVPQQYCSPMSLYADICTSDMPAMGSCKTFVNMCGNSSTIAPTVNAQCKEATSTALPGIPTSKIATQNIKSICTEMSMPGCEQCSIPSDTAGYAQCDLLGTYSLLCKAMPDMRQCAEWKQMCAATPGLSLCSTSSNGGSNDPPVMKMFFHTGIVDYVLFEKWVPRTNGQYAGTWFAVFFFGILYEAWQAFIATYEAKRLYGRSTSGSTSSSKSELVLSAVDESRSERLKRALVRGVAKFVTATGAYALMLVAMTFNVGLFFGVVSGLAVGAAIFSEWTRAAVQAAVLNEASGEELCC
ncbi:hypothetical protein SpCBS45565_g05113 [Spizellomyces sp. 'palustris']|nr:hypothetical protein SpCBS45565_g05113 [Spizellomyces sp. 'palustris']